MRKIKRPVYEQEKKHMEPKSKKALFSTIGVVVVLLVALILFENLNDNKILIKNNTDLKLEYVKAYFVDAEGPMEGTDTYLTENLNSGKNWSKIIDKINLVNTESNLEIYFKFENEEEMFVDAGIFNDEFDGKISISFSQKKDDLINLKVKASNGILPSKLIQCNENYQVNLAEGYVD